MNHDAAIPVEEVVEELAPQRWFRSYPEYRDSGVEWLGSVPDTWNQRRLKFCARLVNQKTEASASDLPYVGMENIESHTGRLIGMEGETNADGLSNLFESGDVLFGKLRPYLAKALHATMDGLCSSELLVYRPMEIVPQFMLYYMLSGGFVRTVDASTYGAKMPRASSEFIGNLPLLLPSPDEQRAIAAFLDRETARIDELIAKKQRLIELLAEKRTALISHAVTRGLNPDAPMKDSGIAWFGDIPTHWEITRLGWVANEVSDINHEMPTSVTQGVAFLSAKDLLDDGTLNFSEAIKRISEDDFERLARKSRPWRGDIIYSRIGACLGKARLVEVDERFLVSYSCCVVRVNQSVADRRFFRHLLDAEMVLTEAKMRTQGIGVPDLGLREICRFPVPLPPRDEQCTIADYLDEKVSALRSLAQRISEGLEQLREYRSALISAAVTGKIDVRKVALVVPARRANVHFHRCVLAAEIVDHHLDTSRCGKIKLQKLLILAERHLGLDEIQSQPVRAAAGPFDNRMMRAIHAQLKRQKWFDPTKTEHGTKYVPMEKQGGHREYFERYWGDKRERFDALMVLLRPMKTEQAEIVATLYIAWNDFIIAGAKYNDERIVSEVLNNWDDSKQSIEPDRWRRALAWMKEKGLIPCGYGSPTRTRFADAN